MQFYHRFFIYFFLFFLPELVNAFNGLLDVVMMLEVEGVTCDAATAAAKVARFCMVLRPDRHMHSQFQDPSNSADV